MDRQNAIVIAGLTTFLLIIGGLYVMIEWYGGGNRSQALTSTSSPHPVSSSTKPQSSPSKDSANFSPAKASLLSKPQLETIPTETLQVSVRTPGTLATSQDLTEATLMSQPAPNLSPIAFPVSRTDLSPLAKARLDQYAGLLRNSHWSVLIQGHTDRQGTVKKNLYVGQRRAEMVKQYLVSSGIRPSRLHAVSFGEYAPHCLEATEDCLQQNRRVVFAVSSLPTPLIDDPSDEELSKIHSQQFGGPLQEISGPIHSTPATHHGSWAREVASISDPHMNMEPITTMDISLQKETP